MKVLSPEVEIAREELKLAKEIGKDELEGIVKERLSYLKAGEVRISPHSGVILERKVSPGGFVRTGDTAYRIADISKVWVIAEVPQQYAGSVKRGMRVMLSPVGSNETFYGRVAYIFPEVDKEAKTLKVRIDLPRRDLKINQLLEVYFEKPLGNILQCQKVL
ncbi:MAG: efflux RND transporter periplasmic adaptor subunit [Thermosphaera sp.]